MVAYLAHEECAVNGQIFSVAGGRVARIFLAETPGVVLDDISPEAVRDQLAGIEDQANYHEPGSLDAATTILADALTG